MRISKKATIYDIATETKISASTVVAVLNGSWKKRRIAEKTAKLIQKVAGKRGRWKSRRKVKEGETTNDLYAFLTTEPNREVAAIHPKAMPAILTKPEEWETWLTAD